MKKIFAILAVISMAGYMYAQTPDKISYQAVIRNSSSQLVNNHAIGIKISILQGTSNGTVVYTETQTPTTNANGLISIEIGGEAGFNDINWANGPYFIKTETDPTGGTSYNITGTSQILTVPYALYATKAGNISYNNGIRLPNSFDPNNDFIGSEGNFISFGHQGISEDFIGYKNNKFYFKDSPDGGDVVDPDIITGGKIGIGIEYPSAEIHVSGKGLFESNGKIYIGDNRIFFEDNGRIASFNEDYHSIIFRRNENILEFREFGDIVFSSGAIDAQPTNNMILKADGNLELNNKNIRNLADPVNAKDAVTKKYVDTLLKRIEYLELIAGLATISDIDGNNYKIIKIGNQVWMSENLKTIHYNDGTPIPLVIESETWISLITPAYTSYYFNDDTRFLYNWYAVSNTTNGNKNICPFGWHLPYDEEWTILTDYLGGNSVAGGKLKEVGTTHWESPNEGATNESGFTAIPNGWRSQIDGNFYYPTRIAAWWSSSEYSDSDAWERQIENHFIHIGPYHYPKQVGLSVRCLKD